uniref:Uncharacterized protein n=1 Tax=Rhizophagus irregularis (strain DAOM 181602 / DAOM 197198 / MUCL 43194) TaxID=747089 RepID=U9U298_RHIID
MLSILTDIILILALEEFVQRTTTRPLYIYFDSSTFNLTSFFHFLNIKLFFQN